MKYASRIYWLFVPLLVVPAAHGWSWAPVDQYAPPSSLFPNRGSAQVELGAQFAAPGAPADVAHLYGVIHYRDTVDALRSYDLFFSPSLAIWKWWRYELNQSQHAQYVGGFHIANCLDGHVTATDRVLMPAISTNAAIEAGLPSGDVITAVRSNLGCMNNNYSIPFPINNYQGSGSAVGVIPQITSGPTWTQSTQALYSASISVPWLYYNGVLDPSSPQFQADFQSYDAATRTMIQNQMRNALGNVRLENQLRILPDGTVMLTSVWTNLIAAPWVATATDGYWYAPDSAPNGRVFYYDPTLHQYVEPFAGGANPNGMYLTLGSGWVGYFIDTIRPELGLGFEYPASASPSIFPANYTWGPAVLHMDFSTGLPNLGSVLRQTFISIGTKQDIDARSATLQNYVFVFTIGDGAERLCSNQSDDDGDGLVDCMDSDCARSPACQNLWTRIQPTSSQDGPIYGSNIEPQGSYGFWGNWGGTPSVVVGIHTLPAELSNTLGDAFLWIPRTDGAWTTDESALNLNMLVRHIQAGDESQITLADARSTPLDTMGVYRGSGPYVRNDTRHIEFRVTDLVRADFAAGRRSFAWRVEPASLQDSTVSLRYFPTVDSTDSSFLDNRGATLWIRRGESNCTDGIDNDGDGLTDCRDPDCYSDVACRQPDFDRDGDVDQSDFGHLQLCFSAPYPPVISPGCQDTNLNGDDRVDVLDLQRFLACMSGADTTASADCYR